MMKVIQGLFLSILFLMLSPCALSQMVIDTSDLGITAAVNNKLAANPDFGSAHIQVSTINGFVSLSGHLRNQAQIATATEITQATPGVKDVDVSQLHIKGSNSPLSMTDDLISAKIRGLIQQQKIFGDREMSEIPITVETSDGIVTLSGTAKNQKQIYAAIKLAQSISGVRQVKPDIQIESSSAMTSSSLSQ